MADRAGHDSGHGDGGASPTALGGALAPSWATLIDHYVAEQGSLAELARHLMDIVPEALAPNLSDDPMTIERGLRRLRQRPHAEGGLYGRLLVRCLGVPSQMVVWAREMGQYHSRSSDLTVGLRRDQLRLWDRPPISESTAAIWIHIGLASIAHRSQDMAQVEQRVRLARLLRVRAEPAAQIELALIDARLAVGRGELEAAEADIARAEGLLGGLNGEPRSCYRARIQDQRAYVVARGWRASPERLARALAIYEAIPEEDAPPFAAFRRAHGRAWCLWRMGLSGALEEAQAACRHAGDGGLIRFRIMSLGLQAHILGLEGEGAAVLARAERMAARLGDVQLMDKLRGFRQRVSLDDRNAKATE